MKLARIYKFIPITKDMPVFPGTLVSVRRDHIRLTSSFGADYAQAKPVGDAFVNETAIVIYQHGLGEAYPELLVLTERGYLGWHDSDSFGILRHGW